MKPIDLTKIRGRHAGEWAAEGSHGDRHEPCRKRGCDFVMIPAGRRRRWIIVWGREIEVEEVRRD